MKKPPKNIIILMDATPLAGDMFTEKFARYMTVWNEFRQFKDMVTVHHIKHESIPWYVMKHAAWNTPYTVFFCPVHGIGEMAWTMESLDKILRYTHTTKLLFLAADANKNQGIAFDDVVEASKPLTDGAREYVRTCLCRMGLL